MRVWNPQLSKCVYKTAEVHAKYSADIQDSVRDNEKTNTLDDTQNIVQMLYSAAINGVAVVTYDQNISIIGLDKLRLKKQVSEMIYTKLCDHLSRRMTKPTKWLCAQQRLGSAWISAQSDQRLRYALSG